MLKRGTRNFSDRGGLLKLGNFNKHFMYNTRKRNAAGKSFGVFTPRYC